MLMIDNIKNYLYDKKYFINFYDDYIHIFNYIKLLNFSDKEVSLELNDFIINIKGEGFLVTKMTSNEILIKGIINDMEIKR